MPNTLRVDLSYRPLRIGWAVKSDDIAGIRHAMTCSHAMWGGRFNPILPVDQEKTASELVELYRLDSIEPVGTDPAVVAFPDKFPHLVAPHIDRGIFVKADEGQSFSRVLDLVNVVNHFNDQPDWTGFFKDGIRKYYWDDNDPLANVFLMQLGRFPTPEAIGTDYDNWLDQLAKPETLTIPLGGKLPGDICSAVTRATIGRLGLERDYNVRQGWSSPGFYVGNAADPIDLVTFWNIRAADIPLWFIDPAHFARYGDMLPAWEEYARRLAEHLDDFSRHIGIWSRQDMKGVMALFAGKPGLMQYSINRPFFWGGGIRPPSMSLGHASALGVLSAEGQSKPRVTFALSDKPYASEHYFNTQQLAVSISLIGGLYDDAEHTFDIPYIPELNEFLGRTLHFDYSKVRVQPDRIDLIIDAADHDAFLYAMPVQALVNKLFLLAGFKSYPSSGGRILRQLLTQLEGVQGARVFKIPGVRALLKRGGPRDAIHKLDAKTIITDRVDGRGASFTAYAGLHLGPRKRGTQLTPPDVFTYLVEKGLYRIGAQLDCPNCEMSNWMPIDAVKQGVTCELCGKAFDATRQLMNDPWRCRRSGILGAERNAQGAIPVALTMQQLDANLSRIGANCFSPSLELQPVGDPQAGKCEIDFIWLGKSRYPDPTPILLAECKDVGPIPIEEFAKDIENLRRVADAMPARRLKAYILFAKLAPFTTEEIDLAKTLNGKYQERVILLTADELEPYHFYEAFEKKGLKGYGSRLEDLARVTTKLYFSVPALAATITGLQKD